MRNIQSHPGDGRDRDFWAGSAVPADRLYTFRRSGDQRLAVGSRPAGRRRQIRSNNILFAGETLTVQGSPLHPSSGTFPVFPCCVQPLFRNPHSCKHLSLTTLKKATWTFFHGSGSLKVRETIFWLLRIQTFVNPQAVRKDIQEDNITLIPEPPKTENPNVDAPKRKKVNPPTGK